MSVAKFTDGRLREELDRVAEVAGDGAECPPADRIVSSGRGELKPANDRDVVLHIARCTACATGWKIVRDVAAGEGTLAFEVPGRPVVFRGWFRMAAAAAVLLVAVGLGVIFLGPERGREPVYRTQEGMWLESTVDGERPIARDRLVLRWAAGPEGTFYDVRVMSEALEPIAHREGLDRPEFQVPAERLAGQLSGSRLLWQVTARLPDGQRVESETFFAVVD